MGGKKMTDRRRAFTLIFAAVCVYWMAVSGSFERAAEAAAERAEDSRMESVTVLTSEEETPPVPQTPLPEPTPVPEDACEPIYYVEEVNVTARPISGEVEETTITGGLSMKNETAYTVDIADAISHGTSVRLPAEGPQVIIIHTHSSEAYTQAWLDRYQESDNCRTEDKLYNIIRIGDELTAIFEQEGISVIHDREIYDYPSYTGSYSRSGAAVEAYLAQYPDIEVVIDVHRDALGSGDVVYKTMAEENGVVASQVMMLAGTDESGLDHPNWRENLSLVLYLQNAVNSAYPTLMRPVTLVPQRYNQNLAPGMFILEVGCSGNTLQEALAGVRLYAKAAAGALLQLAE